MVGKPSFPDDVDMRDDLRGSAVGTPGLTALDEEREASLADEGGASGAVVESQDAETVERLKRDLPVAHLHPGEEPESHERTGVTTLLVASASFVAAALGVFAYRRWTQ